MKMISKFPERLKTIRRKKGISQQKLGKVLNFGATAISSYENGRNEPSQNVLIKLSHYFDVSIDYLLGTRDTIYPVSDFTEQEIALIHLFRDLTEMGREFVFKILDGLTNKRKNFDIPKKFSAPRR